MAVIMRGRQLPEMIVDISVPLQLPVSDFQLPSYRIWSRVHREKTEWPGFNEMRRNEMRSVQEPSNRLAGVVKMYGLTGIGSVFEIRRYYVDT